MRGRGCGSDRRSSSLRSAPGLARRSRNTFAMLAPIFGPGHALNSMKPTDSSTYNRKMKLTPRCSEEAAYMRSTASLNAHTAPYHTSSSYSLASVGSEVQASQAGFASNASSRIYPNATAYRSENETSFYERSRESQWNELRPFSSVDGGGPSWRRYDRQDSLNMGLVGISSFYSHTVQVFPTLAS